MVGSISKNTFFYLEIVYSETLLLRTFMIFTFVLTFFRVDYEISAINAFVNFIPKVFHLWYGMSRKFYCLF